MVSKFKQHIKAITETSLLESAAYLTANALPVLKEKKMITDFNDANMPCVCEVLPHHCIQLFCLS